MISLTKQFVKEMERRILTEELPIGEKIPPLRVLAEEFHVSRSVINAGIVELCNDGYLIIVPRKYICVSDWRKTGNFALLNGLIDNRLCDDNFFDDLLAGRMTVEKAIAREAEVTRTELDLEAIRKIIAMEKNFCSEHDDITIRHATQNTEKRAAADKEFHHALAVALKNQDADDAEKIMEKLLIHGEMELRK